MSRAGALVANLLTMGFLGAIAREVAVLATVVAARPIHTISRHVAPTTTREAGPVVMPAMATVTAPVATAIPSAAV